MCQLCKSNDVETSPTSLSGIYAGTGICISLSDILCTILKLRTPN